MARLIVEALSEDALASPENREPAHIITSVTATNGTPITGLTATNFRIQAVLVAPFGAEVQIGSWFIAPHPGIYGIELIPVREWVWKEGVYTLYVVVKRGTDQGQTLTQLLVNAEPPAVPRLREERQDQPVDPQDVRVG